MPLLIDTAVVPAPQRVDFWSEESHDAYHPLEIRTDVKDRFSARMWGDELASLGVFRIATAANTMTRTPRDIAAGDPEALHVMVLVRGSLKMTQDHRAAVLAPGDMASYDTSRPTMASADRPFAGVILRIPRALLGPHAVPLSGLTAVRLPGAAGLPRLAARFFVGVAEGLAAGAIARDDANVAERVIDLIRGVYAGPVASPGAAEPVLEDRAAPARPGVHRGKPVRPAPRPRADRPGVLHLDPLPASRVQARGVERMRVGPQCAP
jgi:hypothetical protein